MVSYLSRSDTLCRQLIKCTRLPLGLCNPTRSFEEMFVRKRQTDFGILRCRRLNCRNFSGYEVANADKHTGELEYFRIIMHDQINFAIFSR